MSDRMSWGEYAYAGFWRRFAGMLIDGLILSALTSVLAAFVGPTVLVEPLDPETLQLRPGWIPAATGWSAVSLVVLFAYETAMLSTLGWTLGKRVVGVEVRGADGELLSVPRALGRSVGKIISGLPLYLGFLWAAWDPRKQAWHDKFVSSFALKRAWLEPVGQVRPEQLRAQPEQAGGWGQSAWGIPSRTETSPGPPSAQQAPGAPPDGMGVWHAGSGTGQPTGRADEQPGAAPRPEAESAGRGAEEEPGQPPTGPGEEPGQPPTAPGEEPGQPPTAPPGEEPEQPPTAPPGEEPTIVDRLEFETFDSAPPAQRPGETGATPGPETPFAHEEPPTAHEQPPAPSEQPTYEEPMAQQEEPTPAHQEPPVEREEAPADASLPGEPSRGEPAPGEPPPGAAPAEDAAEHPTEVAPADDRPREASSAERAGPGAPAGASPPEDPNLVAVAQGGLAPESASWLDQVAKQVEPRLDRVAPGWRSAPQAAAARACAFGLLLGYLAQLYPHMAADLARVAEQHPSYSTLPAGSRLETLQSLAGDPGRATAWLGPLIGVEDPQRLRGLFD